jgi:hypothetical protein
MILFFFFQKPPQYDQFIKDRNALEDEIKQAEAKLKALNRNIKFIDAVYDPHVTLTENKVNNSDRRIIKGHTQVVMPDGTKIKASVYVGRSEDYPNGKEDEKAISIAKSKVFDQLLKKIPKKLWVGY